MLEEIINQWKNDPEIISNISRWEILPEKKAEYASFPEWVEPQLKKALQNRGIDKLYTHQAEAVETVYRGNNAVVVTPTASGKTLCYNLPVLNRIINEPHARALYLFPTKALSRDQVVELLGLVEETG